MGAYVQHANGERKYRLVGKKLLFVLPQVFFSFPTIFVKSFFPDLLIALGGADNRILSNQVWKRPHVPRVLEMSWHLEHTQLILLFVRKLTMLFVIFLYRRASSPFLR